MSWTDTIPRVIKVGHRDYQVLILDHWEAVDHQVFGRCDTNGGRIQLDGQMDAMKAAETVIHELMHALWNAWNLPEKEAEEEGVVIGLSRGVACICRDNPDLWGWLAEQLRRPQKLEVVA